MTTLPLSPKHQSMQVFRRRPMRRLERETRLELATPNLGKVVLYQLSYSRWVNGLF